MRPVPASVKAPRLPQVNLIPPEIGIRRARSRQRGIVAVAIAFFILVVVSVGYWLSTVKNEAEEDLRALEQELQLLQVQAAAYSVVPLVNEVHGNAQDARLYTGATEIRYVPFWDLIYSVMPAGVEVDVISVNRAQLVTNPPEGQSPFSRADLGFVNITAVSQRPIDSVGIVEALDQIPWLEHVTLSNTRRETDSRILIEGDPVVYMVDVTARINVDLLTQRYLDEYLEAFGVEEETE